MEAFVKATKLKLEFDTPKGMLTIYDLWDLPLTSTVGRANLDSLAIALNEQLTRSATTSFVDKPPKVDETVQIRFDVVKYIIDARIAERDAAKLAEEKKAKKARIVEIMASKQDEALKGMSMEELQKALADL